MKLCAAFGLFALAFSASAAETTVDVILWFDAEDYLLLADDDATKRLAEMLTERGIRATFKFVGEKARVLEQRGRRDVIAALRKHDIGYHSDFHSVHPTPAEYLAECGWVDGVAEFARREGGGAVDVRRVFGRKRLSCYGQPGSSWAAQTIAALPQMGIAPCYVDEGQHIGLDNEPFWYAGGLVVYRMGENRQRMDLREANAVEPAKKRITSVADRLRREGGGLISIFYHPNEWVMEEFWDGVNFSRGANPPRSEWKPPRQCSAEETEARFRRFAEYIDHIRAQANVRFVTAGDLPKIYPDTTRSGGANAEDLDELAKRIVAGQSVDFQIIGTRAYSAADQFELLATAVAARLEGKSLRFPLRAKGLLGPAAAPPPSIEKAQVDAEVFRVAVRDVRDFIQKEQRVPPRVFLGTDSVPPADFLVALARAYRKERIELRRGIALLPERQVAKDTPQLFGGWIIHKEGFRAPKILEQARLQTWTLKPAMRKQ